MNHYIKYKDCIINYLQSPDGKTHLKQAQKNYRNTEAGKKKNNEIALRWYYKKKEIKTLWKEEIERLLLIQLD
jgi:hypothetical protein